MVYECYDANDTINCLANGSTALYLNWTVSATLIFLKSDF